MFLILRKGPCNATTKSLNRVSRIQDRVAGTAEFPSRQGSGRPRLDRGNIDGLPAHRFDATGIGRDHQCGAMPSFHFSITDCSAFNCTGLDR